MSTTVTRTGDAGNNFTQQSTGETPNSISVSTNAKGQAQVDLKLYYPDASAMAQHASEDITTILSEVKRALAGLNIPLAGEGK